MYTLKRLFVWFYYSYVTWSEVKEDFLKYRVEIYRLTDDTGKGVQNKRQAQSITAVLEHEDLGEIT